MTAFPESVLGVPVASAVIASHPRPVAIAVEVCTHCHGAVQLPAGYDIDDVDADLTCWCWIPRATSKMLWVRETLAPPRRLSDAQLRARVAGQFATKSVKAWRERQVMLAEMEVSM
jgi:hypothetical protein